MVLLLTRYLFLTGNTTGKEKMLKLPGSKAYYHILVKQMSAEQRDNDTFILLVISCSKLYTSITLNLNKCTQILYQLYIVGKGGHTPPPFLEIRDVPTFHRFIGKTKVLNNSCNHFVYNFYPQSILVLKESKVVKYKSDIMHL